MGMAAAAVVADLAGPQRVPGLGHVQHHAVLVERLEREGGVRGDLGEEAGVGVAVGVARLAFVVVTLRVTGFVTRSVTTTRKLPYRDLPQDAQTLLGVIVEAPGD